jgi:hypothetical protein
MVQLADETDSAEQSEGDYATYYVTIVDTGKDYYQLDREMYKLSATTHFVVDTMDRHYDAAKKDIILPENYDDEMYRGEYYPRRDEDTGFLSLEHTSQYHPNAGNKSVALVARISTKKTSADSLLAVIRPYAPHGYVVKAKLYTGCMH